MTLPLEDLTKKEIGWLLDQGVSPEAMIEPVCLRGAWATFLGQGMFEFDRGGERAIIFALKSDLGEPDDLIAWQPSTCQIASWSASSFALGEASIFNPASWFMGLALRVHAGPLQWLQSNRDGIVIVQPRLSHAYLAHVPRLSFADPSHARCVRQWCRPPNPATEFLVEVPDERIAA